MHKVNLFQCIEHCDFDSSYIIYFLAAMIVGRNSYEDVATTTTPIVSE
jgi:hypothetical protein